MTTSRRPKAGTRAATTHQLVHSLRLAVADPVHPGQALVIIRGLSEDRARAALAVALISERWTPQERNAMGNPPAPDWDEIATENARLRREYEDRHKRARQDSEVVFDERDAA